MYILSNILVQIVGIAVAISCLLYTSSSEANFLFIVYNDIDNKCINKYFMDKLNKKIVLY